MAMIELDNPYVGINPEELIREAAGLPAYPQICPKCGRRTVVIPWNSRVDIAICDNKLCKWYRTPMSCRVGASRRYLIDQAIEMAGRCPNV